jgi:hypothetical protein
MVQTGQLEQWIRRRGGRYSSTSTATLQVVVSDEKGTQCLGIKLAYTVPVGYKYGGSRPPGWGSLESETVRIWSWISRDLNLRLTVAARTSSNCERHTHPLIREGSPHQQTRNCLTNKNLVLDPRWGAWHQNRLADSPLVVTWLWLWQWVSFETVTSR